MARQDTAPKMNEGSTENWALERVLDDQCIISRDRTYRTVTVTEHDFRRIIRALEEMKERDARVLKGRDIF